MNLSRWMKWSNGHKSGLLNRCTFFTRFQSQWIPGQSLGGQFRVERCESIPELDLTVLEALHTPTQARLVHLQQPGDPNRVFAVAFRTLPSDSTGVAHILEHTVLCGSQAYPVRDPFFQMLNRSLASYMNAWTASDMTVYPFSTVNEQDWRNLRGVYLDAVFHPLLRPQDFRQEAWRLERTEEVKGVEDASSKSDFTFKGVVYNEMKGALADAESLFHHRFHQAILPGSTYGHCSGGDPPSITSLSLEQLVNFHHRFYRPSNALFYSYGPVDLAEHSEYLNKVLESTRTTSNHPFMEAGPSIFSKSLIDHYAPPHPRIIHCLGPADPTAKTAVAGEEEDSLSLQQKDARIACASIVVPSAQLNFDLSLLSGLLLDGPSSPLHKALLTSGLGKDYAPGTGYDAGSMPVGVFTVGLQGMAEVDIDGFPERIRDILHEVIKDRDGVFNAERVEAQLHAIELSRRDRSASFGMGLLHGLASSWCHRVDDLIDPLRLTQRIKTLRRSMEQAGGAPAYFAGLVKEYLLENPRKLVFSMRPAPKYQEGLEAEERERLQTIAGSLSPAERDALERSNRELSEFQNQQERERRLNKETSNPLPCLELGSVPLQGRSLEYRAHQAAPNILIRQTPSANDLYHLNVIAPIGNDGIMSPQDQLNLPILCDALTELFIKGWTVDAYELAWRTYTGGMSVAPFQGRKLVGSPLGRRPLNLHLASHALATNQARMFDLFGETLGNNSLGTRGSDTKEVHDRLRSLIQMNASSASNSLASSGTGYAMKFAAAALDAQGGLISDRLGGIRQVIHLNRLSAAAEDAEINSIQESLYEIWERIRMVPLTDCKAAILTHSDQITMKTPELFNKFVQTAFKMKREPGTGTVTIDTNERNNLNSALLGSAIRLPINTNFSAKVIQIVEAETATTIPSPVLSANLKLAARLMKTGFLHPEIRERNGAYGAGAGYSGITGQFHFYSHRDPNPVGSVEKYGQAVEWILREGSMSEQAKLSLFASIDAPVDLAAEGMEQIKYGISDEERQAFREAVFAATPSTVREAVSAHLAAESPQHACIVGGAADLDRLNENDWKSYDGIDNIEP